MNSGFKSMAYYLRVLLIPEPDDLRFRVAFSPTGEVDSVS